MNRRKALAILALAVLVAPPLTRAQSPPMGAQPQAQGGAASRDDQDYRIGPGDLLSLHVYGTEQFDRAARVSNSGKLHFPHLGVIRVHDLSVSEVQMEVAKRLRDAGLVNNPWVHIRVEQYRAQPVYILGEVMNPGQFLIKDEMYVNDLITMAAGFNDVASPIGYLYRRKSAPEAAAHGIGPGSSVDEVIEIDFKDLKDGRNPELNVKLRGGDVLYCPQRRKEAFFVVGEVAAPGVYEFPAEGEILVSQAIAKAGGPQKTAKTSKGVLVRFEPDGTRQEMSVDAKAIIEGRRPDITVRANDIIFIPGSSAKTLGYGMLSLIPGSLMLIF